MTRTSVHRPTSQINHHRTLSAAAATGLVGSLLALTLGSASAMPGRADHPTGPAVPAGTAHSHSHSHSHGHYVAHGCFITPHNWSEALAGPLPICYTHLP